MYRKWCIPTAGVDGAVATLPVYHRSFDIAKDVLFIQIVIKDE